MFTISSASLDKSPPGLNGLSHPDSVLKQRKYNIICVQIVKAFITIIYAFMKQIKLQKIFSWDGESFCNLYFFVQSAPFRIWLNIFLPLQRMLAATRRVDDQFPVYDVQRICPLCSVYLIHSDGD